MRFHKRAHSLWKQSLIHLFQEQIRQKYTVTSKLICIVYTVPSFTFTVTGKISLIVTQAN